MSLSSSEEEPEIVHVWLLFPEQSQRRDSDPLTLVMARKLSPGETGESESACFDTSQNLNCEAKLKVCH